MSAKRDTVAALRAAKCGCGKQAVELFRKIYRCYDCLIVEEQPKRSIWGNSPAYIPVSTDEQRKIGISDLKQKLI